MTQPAPAHFENENCMKQLIAKVRNIVSVGRHLGGIYHMTNFWKTQGKHLGDNRETFERSGELTARHLGDTWEISGTHLGDIWKTSGRHLGDSRERSEKFLGDMWERHLGEMSEGDIWETSGDVRRHLCHPGQLEARGHLGGKICTNNNVFQRS